MLRLAGDEAELITIAVDPKWRGKGVGRRCCAPLFDDLLLTPARRMLLEVAADNPRGDQALPASRALPRSPQRKGYYPAPDGTPATALVMARDLG